MQFCATRTNDWTRSCSRIRVNDWSSLHLCIWCSILPLPGVLKKTNNPIHRVQDASYWNLCSLVQLVQLLRHTDSWTSWRWLFCQVCEALSTSGRSHVPICVTGTTRGGKHHQVRTKTWTPEYYKDNLREKGKHESALAYPMEQIPSFPSVHTQPVHIIYLFQVMELLHV